MEVAVLHLVLAEGLVLHLVLAEAAEGRDEALAEAEAAGRRHGILAEAEVQRMGEGPDAGPLPEKREHRSATAHQRSRAPRAGAASGR